MGLFPFQYEVYSPIFQDPRGPIKFEPSDFGRLVAELPELGFRLEAIEAHLAAGGKQPFIRNSDRVQAGDLGQVQRTLETLTNRLNGIEQQLKSK